MIGFIASLVHTCQDFQHSFDFSSAWFHLGSSLISFQLFKYIFHKVFTIFSIWSFDVCFAYVLSCFFKAFFSASSIDTVQYPSTNSARFCNLLHYPLSLFLDSCSIRWLAVHFRGFWPCLFWTETHLRSVLCYQHTNHLHICWRCSKIFSSSCFTSTASVSSSSHLFISKSLQAPAAIFRSPKASIWLFRRQNRRRCNFKTVPIGQTWQRRWPLHGCSCCFYVLVEGEAWLCLKTWSISAFWCLIAE